MKICQVGAKLLHADILANKWTDMTKLIVTFRNFANTPKDGSTKFSAYVQHAVSSTQSHSLDILTLWN
jgi:hypothetical protein